MKIGLREVVFVLMLLAIPLGGWYLVFRPRNVANAEMLRQIEAKQAKLQDLNKTTGAIGDIQREIDSLQKGVNDLQSRLPSEKEIDKVLQEVWRLAETNELTTKSIRTVEKTQEPVFASADDSHAEQPIVMKLEGDFRGFYAFMLALENQPRIMRIRKMTLTRPDKAAEGVVQATFEMTIFFERATKEKA